MGERTFKRNMGGNQWDYISGGARIYNSLMGTQLVAPTVDAASSTDTNGNTVEIKTRDNVLSDIGYLLLTINGADDATDSARFNVPDATVLQLNFGEVVEIPYDVDITRVSIVGVARENNLTSGIILAGDGTGNITTALNTFTFSAGIQVIKVSVSKVFISPIATTEDERKYCTFSVLGSA